jgi:hypothetical protein
MNTQTTTTKTIICTVFWKGQYLRGEYTGYSEITKKHYVSLYNGDVARFDKLEDVKFD